jgi:hypothetical protein
MEGAADARGVGRARANHGMSSQRTIQPRDCCGPTASTHESGIRAPSRGRHPVPGQGIAGNACGRDPNGTHPTAVLVGMESQERPSDAIAGRASDRHRAQQRAGGTHPNAIAGSALGRQHRRQVSAFLRRGAAQPAHAARRRSGHEIGAIVAAVSAKPQSRSTGAARLMRQALARHCKRSYRNYYPLFSRDRTNETV